MGVVITDINGNVVEDSSRTPSRDGGYDRNKPEIGNRGGDLSNEYRKPSIGYDVDVGIQPVTPTERKRNTPPPPRWQDIDKTPPPPEQTPVLH